MHAFAAGAALAARSLGYRHTAALIENDGLDAEAVSRLFALSASKTCWHDAALILLAGSVARYRAQPVGWTAEPERGLVMELLRRRGNTDRFDKLAAKASAMIVKA